MTRPAIFLDRDGTLIEERRYLSDPEGVALIEGVPEALRILRDAGYLLVVVTNQSGIGRGYYTEAEYQAVRERLDLLLEAEGIRLDGSWHCPADPRAGGSPLRKPEPGMHLLAAEELDIDLSRSICIGDRESDLLPAERFGGRAILVRTGYGTEEEAKVTGRFPVVADLREAAHRILASRSR